MSYGARLTWRAKRWQSCARASSALAPVVDVTCCSMELLPEPATVQSCAPIPNTHHPAPSPPPRDLEARSEQELDEMVSKLTFRMQHESIPLNEEKRILAQLKKLEAQRERVRECEASGELLEEGRQRRKELMDQWGEHNSEIKLLADEKNTAHAILEKFREQARGRRQGSRAGH